MLVLSRLKGEKICIGDDITIEVVEIRGGGRKGARVRIGILAPKEVPIDRLEVHEAKKEKARAIANQTEANGGPQDQRYDHCI